MSPLVVPASGLQFDSDLVTTYNGSVFTGVAFEDLGLLGRSEVSYVDGRQEGVAKDWYPSGAIKVIARYVDGTLHGLLQEFSESGVLEQESRYAYGICVWRRAVDPSGDLSEEEHIDLESEVGRLLVDLRRELDWPEDH